MPITVLENMVSNAERRTLQTGEGEIVPRVADVYAALPSITGKIELEYEGELVGGQTIARELIRRAADATVRERAGVVNADEVVVWFDVGGALEVTDDASSESLVKGFETVPTLLDIVRDTGLAPADDTPLTAAACELVLEALVARKKISRTDAGRYSRAVQEQRRRPNQDLFGGGMSA
jgi:magnesium chelatase subunit I